jgi:hypothetical protein|tara:strand:- start:3837 stop:4343 length:507 start_codon:yes stop_codon:yes gene_type:complete
MGATTFSGPVKSLGGFISAGSDNDINITADDTLTVQGFAGRMLRVNDADCKITLPTIVATTPNDPTAPDQTNNIGASFSFFIETAATDLDIKTDGTDKFVGGLYTGVTNATGKTFIAGAANDVITLNGTTKGGLAGSTITVTAIASAKYAVSGFTLGSGTLVTPFADA